MLDIEIFGKLAELPVRIIRFRLDKIKIQVDILKIKQVKVMCCRGAHGIKVLWARPWRRGVHAIHALLRVLKTTVGKVKLLSCCLNFW